MRGSSRIAFFAVGMALSGRVKRRARASLDSPTPIKQSLGRIELTADLAREMEENALLELPIRWPHARAAGALPRHHEDPFDRMLIAQARSENLALVSYDSAFRDYDVTLLPESPR